MIDKKDMKRKTISGLGFRFAERITAQLVSTLVTIILARILLPEEFGTVSLVTILITICNVFVESGLGTALVQKKDADQQDFSTVFWASIILAIVLYTILFFGAPFVARMYQKDALTAILRVMGVRLPLAAVNSVQHAFVNRKMMFKKFFWATLTGTIVSGIVGITMAYCGCGPWALVCQYLTNVCMDTIFLWCTVKWRPAWFFSWEKFKALFTFGSRVLASGLLTTLYEEVRGLIIAGVYTTADLSFYTKGQQFPKLIANNVSTTINNVMFPVLSTYQDNTEQMKSAVKRSVRLCAYLMFPMLTGFAAMADTFVLVVLTDKWLPIVPYIYIFCAFYMFKPLRVINQSCLKALGKTTVYLIINIVEKTIGVIMILLLMNHGVYYLALSALITFVIAAMMNLVCNGRYIHYSTGEQLVDLLPALCLSSIMCVVVYFLGKLQLSIYLRLFIQLVGGFVVYAGLSKAFRVDSFLYILKTIKSYAKKTRRNIEA